MMERVVRRSGRNKKPRITKVSEAELDALIEEATGGGSSNLQKRSHSRAGLLTTNAAKTKGLTRIFASSGYRASSKCTVSLKVLTSPQYIRTSQLSIDGRSSPGRHYRNGGRDHHGAVSGAGKMSRPGMAAEGGDHNSLSVYPRLRPRHVRCGAALPPMMAATGNSL
jgi:hypothetical protein